MLCWCSASTGSSSSGASQSVGAQRDAEAARRRPVTDDQSLVQRVKALAEALAGSPVGELDLTEDGTRIVIRRRLEDPLFVPARPARGAARATGSLGHTGEAAAPEPDPGVAILAPLTGVYYAAASPSSPPYVEVGDSVTFGQVVCLVEAMKVFNEVTSEVAGVVTAFVAQPGQLVHKGDALLRVQPA